MPTDHALVLDNESHGMGTGCSRCGATSREDLEKPCPAVSDGKMYTQRQRMTPQELEDWIGPVLGR